LPHDDRQKQSDMLHWARTVNQPIVELKRWASWFNLNIYLRRFAA
jgi:hypothetical protein